MSVDSIETSSRTIPVEFFTLSKLDPNLQSTTVALNISTPLIFCTTCSPNLKTAQRHYFFADQVGWH